MKRLIAPVSRYLFRDRLSLLPKDVTACCNVIGECLRSIQRVVEFWFGLFVHFIRFLPCWATIGPTHGTLIELLFSVSGFRETRMNKPNTRERVPESASSQSNRKLVAFFAHEDNPNSGSNGSNVFPGSGVLPCSMIPYRRKVLVASRHHCVWYFAEFFLRTLMVISVIGHWTPPVPSLCYLLSSRLTQKVITHFIYPVLYFFSLLVYS